MIYTIKNTAFNSNTYLLSDDEHGDCIIIDPGINLELAESCIAAHNIKPIAIICTHGHFDHIANVSFFKERYNIPFYVHEKDLRALKSANFFLKVTGINFIIKTPVPDVVLKDEITHLKIGPFNAEVRNFPGHSPGSCIIKIGDSLFSGDILYKKGLGFNRFPDENPVLLRNSITTIFSYYSPGHMVYPGHGSAETLGLILKNNNELVEFLKQGSVHHE